MERLNFAERLLRSAEEKGCPCVAGLDPRPEYVPGFLKSAAEKEFGRTGKAAAEAVLAFNRRLLDALHEVVPAVKLQLACYEMLGPGGMEVFSETAAHAKKLGLLVIADGKRNDIGSTAEAYALAYLGNDSAFGADALTVNPYLGSDGINPFIAACRNYGKGIFVLVKTSNPSSGELQDMVVSDGRKVYEVVADLVSGWVSSCPGGGYGDVGAVVGATWPEQARELRKRMPRSCFLVPGYGAQGGTAEDCAACFDEDGSGAVVNASRSILCAYRSERWRTEFDEARFDLAARAEAVRMRDDITNALKRKGRR